MFAPCESILSLTLDTESNLLQSFSFSNPDYIGNTFGGIFTLFFSASVLKTEKKNPIAYFEFSIAIAIELCCALYISRKGYQEVYQTNRISFLTVWRKQQELN